ncbi:MULTISPECIES: fimbrial protein [unclassified Pseudomonas]|uniref:fimbrial protein n=1 Tax=unclassified Pseudomonas TaxID=196821 RepID=UPI000996812C|nr:fimbrial protein [Pseudomonas sp. MF4836]OOV89395.1 pilus assembly protein [Pseudomonas sp. MF4836]
MKGYAGLLLMLAGGAISAQGQAAQNMTLFGTLIEPAACTINDGGQVDVDFGNRIGVNKVDGVNYWQPMSYRITCDPNASTQDMTLEVVGIQADYDSAAVVSDVKDLAIQIKQNGQPFELNKPIPITRGSPPVLSAVPVKRLGAVLNEGPFEATATLRVGYP